MIHIFLQSLVTHRGFPKTKKNEDQVPCPDAALFHLAMSACWWEHALRLFQRMEEASGICDGQGFCLVGGLENGSYFSILGIIIPTDFHIFRGVGIPPTRFCGCV